MSAGVTTHWAFVEATVDEGEVPESADDSSSLRLDDVRAALAQGTLRVLHPEQAH